MIAIYLAFMIMLFSIIFISPTAQDILIRDDIWKTDLLISVIFLISVILFFYFSPVSKYHGAEHKAINTILAGQVPTMDNLRKASRVSQRCGTVYMTIVLFILLILSPFINIFIAFLIAISVGFELFIAEQKWLVKILRPIISLSMFIQKYITTREPTDKHLVVAQAGIHLIYKTDILEKTKVIT